MPHLNILGHNPDATNFTRTEDNAIAAVSSIKLEEESNDLTPLYRYDSTGKPRFCVFEVKDGSFRCHTGIIGGAVQTGDWTVCEPKNVGKKNETTAEEQALKEAQALWTKRTDKGYATDLASSGALHVEPMLAEVYDEDDPQCDFNAGVYCQPKLDGMRCLANKDGLWSREGKRIEPCIHIEESLKWLFDVEPDLVLDGEIYNHDLAEDFNKIMSLARKTRAKLKPEDIEAIADNLQFHIYDLAIPELTFEERYLQLLGLHGNYMHQDICRVVETNFYRAQPNVDIMFRRCLREKYEGLMVRDPKSEYAFGKRPKSLLKRKDFVTEEFKATRVEEGKGKSAGKAKRIFFECSRTGAECKAGTRGDDEFTAMLWDKRDEIAGKIITVRYQNLTPAGKYRMATVIDYHGMERTD